MGPPREHGGMLLSGLPGTRVVVLQWGRRVNTAEWSTALHVLGGDWYSLQWGRRVNTAECKQRRAQAAQQRKALQWGRRVNTAEWIFGSS